VRGLVAPMLAVTVLMSLVGECFCLAGRYLGGVGGLLGGVGGFLRRLDLPLGRFGSATSLFGGGPGLICPPQGSVHLRFVRPLLRHLGGFLGQVGGLFRCGGGFLRPVGAVAGPVGAVARLVRQAPGLIGRLLGVELGVAEICVAEIGFPGRAGEPAESVRGCVVHGRTVVLFFDGTPGHVVGLTSLGHALAGSGLPGLVLSHDHFFPTGLPASARHGERS